MIPGDALNHIALPSQFAREKLGFSPDPVQTAVLDSLNPRLLLCCSRQWGKSSTTAIRAVHQALFFPGSLILIAAPAGRQSGEVFKKCEKFLSELGITRRGDGVNAISFVLANGSRLVGLPNAEATIRGFSAPSFLLIDEASRLSDELYHALLPMLATTPGSRLWLLSTPNGKQGFFYEEWANPTSRYAKFTVTAYDTPRIQREWLEEQAATMPRHLFEQEYLCLFQNQEGSLLTEEELQGALDPSATPLA